MIPSGLKCLITLAEDSLIRTQTLKWLKGFSFKLICLTVYSDVSKSKGIEASKR